MKALGFKSHGDISAMQFFDTKIPDIKPDEVLIQIKASAFNHLDIWIRKGWQGLNLLLPHISGSDGAGVIVKLGAEVSQFKEGDRVTINPGIIYKEDLYTFQGEHSVSPNFKILGENISGTHCEYVAVPAKNVLHVPDHITFETAAAANLVCVTAWRMLIHRAKIKVGESVLVLGAGGGVNSIALQLAKFCGCHVFAITHGEEKIAKTKALGVDGVVDYKADKDWFKTLYQMTDGQGFDVVVDNVGQATLNKSLKLVKPGGRIVIVGNTSGPEVQLDLRYLFVKQISLIGSTMGNFKDFQDVMKLVFKGHITPIIDKVYSFDQGIEAMQNLEAGKQFGKLVLQHSL